MIGSLSALCRKMNLPAILVSHSLEEVSALCSQIAMMRSGKIEASGPLFTVVNSFANPFACAASAEALLEGVVSAHDEQFQLTRVVLERSDLSLLVGRLPLSAGRRVVLRILARDVSLALKRPESSSILNILPARVHSLQIAAQSDQGHVTALLDLGNGHFLFSRITQFSAGELALQSGQLLFAQIKSVAIMCGSDNPA
jgi:molybdate transport system ATP-binding protein